MSLKGKCAFVTGATGGMGFSIVEKLSEAACQVIATDMVEEEKARNKLSVIQQMSEIKYIQCDLRRKENIDELCKELDTICPEGIDILVNVAGPLYHDVRVRYIKKYYWKKPSVFKLAQLLKSENLKIMCNLGTFSFGNAVENMSIEDWNNELHINLTTPFILTKHVLPNMKQKKWGRIVYVASQLGLVAVPYASAYIASKTGLLGLAKAVALETAEFGITCNAACPGPTLTPLLQDFFLHYQNEHKATYEEAKDALRKKMPTKSYTTVSQKMAYANLGLTVDPAELFIPSSINKVVSTVPGIPHILILLATITLSTASASGLIVLPADPQPKNNVGNTFKAKHKIKYYNTTFGLKRI